MRPKMSKTVSARIGNNLHQSLIDECNKQGISVSELLINILQENFSVGKEKKSFSNEETSDMSISELKRELGIKP